MDLDLTHTFPIENIGHIRLLNTFDEGDPAQALIQFSIRMPLYLAREWCTYTLGVHRSKMMVSLPINVYIPQEIIDPTIQDVYKSATAAALYAYQILLEEGMPYDIIEGFLPQNVFVEFTECGGLFSYMFLNKLVKQQLIQNNLRLFGQTICDIIRVQYPFSWNALVDEIVPNQQYA